MKYQYTVENSLIEQNFNTTSFHGQQGIDFLYQYTLPPTTYIGKSDQIKIGIFEDGKWKPSEHITNIEYDHD